MFPRSLRILIALLAWSGCAQDAEIEEGGEVFLPPPPPREDLGPVGTPDAFDVLTWNLERFPKRGAETLEAVAKALLAIQPDVVAVQEVMDGYALFDLAESMPGWQADVAAFFDPSGPYNPPVGMLWNTSTVEVQERYLLFEDDPLAFPRPPLVLELTWQNLPMVVINVHLKALGDDYIDFANPWDEEVRRLRACEKLDLYIRENLDDQRVVLLGDFNDRIEEPMSTNVFAAFLNRPGSYLIADMPIALDPMQPKSYPKRGSHIDHVIISDELFASYFRQDSFTRTIPIDRSLMDSWYEYESRLSDHRPVLLHLSRGSAWIGGELE